MSLDEAWIVVLDAGAGTLVRSTRHGLRSVVAPVVVSADRTRITTHLARANEWWRDVDDGTEVLGLFMSASAYVSPLFYPSRLDDPRVVPTWNYVAVELRGTLWVHNDPEWLYDQVGRQTSIFEARRATRWRVADAPPDYIDSQIKAIVGIEIEVTSIEGKAKLSQNRSANDRASVREHLSEADFSDRQVARRMGRGD